MKHLIILSALFLPACASITTGTTQSVLVDSKPSGADCQLTNDKGSWFIKRTPASATVSKASGPLTANCQKGKLVGTASIEPESEPAAFGNVLAGGIIGAAIDMGSGAAWFYPPTITVQLRKE